MQVVRHRTWGDGRCGPSHVVDGRTVVRWEGEVPAHDLDVVNQGRPGFARRKIPPQVVTCYEPSIRVVEDDGADRDPLRSEFVDDRAVRFAQSVRPSFQHPIRIRQGPLNVRASAGRSCRKQGVEVRRSGSGRPGRGTRCRSVQHPVQLVPCPDEHFAGGNPRIRSAPSQRTGQSRRH